MIPSPKTKRRRRIEIPKPHDNQRKLLDLEEKNLVLFAGRRFGKTQVAVYKILSEATKTVGLYWWVGLSWQSASMKRAERLLIYYVSQMWGDKNGQNSRKYLKRSKHELILPNGSQIWMRTAENETSLAGEGIRGAVVDEFTLMKERVWTEYLQATLADYDGWVWFIGIPKGEGWHATLWRNAAKWDDWYQGHFTSYDNPTIPNLKEWLDNTKTKTTEAMFGQEYMALILESGGAVFRRLKDALTPKGRVYQPQSGRRYVMGVDWGRHNDYTVFTIWDIESRTMVHMERFTEIGWTLQRSRLTSCYLKWRPEVIIAESNSMGETNIEQLQRDKLPVRDFNTHHYNKVAGIELLATDMERGVAKVLNDDDVINEFSVMQMVKTPRAKLWTYQAPEGEHDDIVMSAMFGYSYINYLGSGFF